MRRKYLRVGVVGPVQGGAHLEGLTELVAIGGEQAIYG